MANENGVGAVSTNTFQYNPYANYNYGMYDFDDLDMNNGMYGMYSMGGSIFGNGYLSPIMGGAYNNQNYFDNMKQYQKFNVDYNIEQQKLNRNADMKINASMEGIKNAASILKDKIVANEQDQIQEAYQNYVNAVATAYGDGTPAEIKARATTLYAKMNDGQTLVQDLRQYAHGSTTQGFIQALTLGTFDRKSAEDNISEITGAPVNAGEKAKQNIGRATGALTLGGIVGGIAKAIGKSGATAGAAGAIAGGVSLLMSFITGKVTT
jgi:hypothetical protein